MITESILHWNQFHRLPQFLSIEIIWVFFLLFFRFIYSWCHFNVYTKVSIDHRIWFVSFNLFNQRISIDRFNGSVSVCFRFYRLTHVYSHHSFILKDWIKGVNVFMFYIIPSFYSIFFFSTMTSVNETSIHSIFTKCLYSMYRSKDIMSRLHDFMILFYSLDFDHYQSQSIQSQAVLTCKRFDRMKNSICHLDFIDKKNSIFGTSKHSLWENLIRFDFYHLVPLIFVRFSTKLGEISFEFSIDMSR